MSSTVYTSSSSPVPTVRAANLATSGHAQAIVKCPGCRQLHRHLGVGLRRSPCGRWYVVTEPRKTRTAA